MQLENILNQIINVVFLFFGNKLAGMRTIIINTIALILACWEFISKDGGLFQFLCDNFNILCEISEGQFYVIALAILAALNNILRRLTVAPVGVNVTPAEVSISQEPTPEQKVASGIAVVSAIVLFIVILIIIL